jgi:hypothetical protein
MAKWYTSLEYGVYNGLLINRAEYLLLKKAGVVFVIEE